MFVHLASPLIFFIDLSISVENSGHQENEIIKKEEKIQNTHGQSQR